MISTLSLTQLHYTQLDATTWCATAKVSETFKAQQEKIIRQTAAFTSHIACYDFAELNWQHYSVAMTLSVRELAHKQRQLQRQGVRLLLKKLLSKLNINDSLDESSFPYRLNNNGYYVCFSHTSSANKSSVNERSASTLNETLESRVAVIISRHRPVGIDVESNHVKWRIAQRFYSINELSVLNSLPISQRDNLAKLLWQIKESFIKIHQYTLAQGLGMNYAALIPDLMCCLEGESTIQVVQCDLPHYRVAILPNQQTIVIF
ncbi:Phosphopantethiene-protein transferase domain family protein [Psychrobacter sp. JB385]|nr:Phosphopantethiene-protein transferase domain family protein [Psychrobacter sp. JB385]